MRLDKFIGAVTDLSRRQIQAVVKAGAVQVNGEPVYSAARQVDIDDQINVDGQLLSAPKPRYLMLHKPAGYVCANSDGDHPTVIDLLDIPRAHTLQIVGRLDVDTTGLVLLTDDGQWNHRMTSPRRDCSKIYHLTTADPIDPSAVDRFAEGVSLQGEKKPTLPAHLEILGQCEARLHLKEGKYHQVKRMFATLGNRVTSLHREAIGKIHLDTRLAPGEYRALTPGEISHD